jgi:alpha-glucoside transport system substrate-binding protein
MPMDRRQALAVLSGLAAAGPTECGGETPLRIAVVWSGWELSRFREILEAYPRPLVVYSVGDNSEGTPWWRWSRVEFAAPRS